VGETSQFIGGKKRSKRAAPPLAERKLMAFRWYGGKFSHLDWLLPLLDAETVTHFVDVFGGSAAVILNRSPSPVDTYNDIDGELTNFFRVLRDGGNDLIRLLELTPFSREEFAAACEASEAPDTDLERARRFFVRAEQARTGLAQTASLGRWANCKDSSRRGMSGSVSRWLSKIEHLPEVVDRLRTVQIENRPAIDLIDAYDSPGTLFYLDPPYVHDSRSDTRAYAHEMTDADHQALAERLAAIKGKFALSGYRSETMDELFGNWKRLDAPSRTAHSAKVERQESLWLNYRPRS
jgi:DNA adenine methylase